MICIARLLAHKMPNLGCDDSKLPQPEEYLVLKYNLSSLVANAIDESDL